MKKKEDDMQNKRNKYTSEYTARQVKRLYPGIKREEKEVKKVKKRIVLRIKASKRALNLLEKLLAVIAASALLSAIHISRADPWQMARLLTVHSLIIENYIASLLIAFGGSALFESVLKSVQKKR